MIIDLCYPIQEHWRYGKFKREELSSFARGDQWQITGFTMGSHWFSHMDFPRHTGAEYPDSEAFPLDAYNGKASIINLTRPDGCKNYGFTKEDMERATAGRNLESIWLLRSDWGLQSDWNTRNFWNDAPSMTTEALEWIAERRPSCVVFDFPQDYAIRELQFRKVGPDEQPSHTILLRRNILMVEYVTNFDKIGKDSCDFYCLPLKLPHIDGCPVRAIAVV
jgi:kynurenine formamidase